MRREFEANLDGLVIVKDRDQLFDGYFIDGHPHALIPGFVGTYNHSDTGLPNGLTGTINDIHQLMFNWPSVELAWGEELDQNGGEYDVEYQLADDGLITIGYTVYEAEYSNKAVIDELKFILTGYVITHPKDDYQILVITSLEMPSC